MDAKKKRNKKKKGNQTKNADEIISNTEEAVAQDNSNGSAVAQPIQNEEVLVSSEGAYLPEQAKESDGKRPFLNGSVSSGGASPLEQDKDSDRKQLIQNGSVSVNSVVPSVSVPAPDKEMDKHNKREEKFVKLQETLTQLEDWRNSWLQKAMSLEVKLSKMQDKVDTYVQHEVDLGRKLQVLQNENDMLAKKQVSLENKFEGIEDMKYSWSLKEGSLNATISLLEEANRALQMRVKALEQSTDNTGQENQKLIESLSLVESRIMALEAKSVHDTPAADMAKIMEEKGSVTITEPADTQTHLHSTHFVEPPRTVNEVDTKQDEITKDISKSELGQESCLDLSSPSVENIHENSENLLRAGEAMQYPGTTPVTADSSNGTTITDYIDQVQKLELYTSSVETMHPLQDVEINQAEVASSDETTGEVPLSDAPLIGAPFRLFSFVAKFVAGSDLVNQTSSRSGH